MPFKKGAPGRPKGCKNNPDTASLRLLLENAFIRNQSAAIAKIDQIFQGKDMTEFKWMCQVKASLEPRQVEMEHSGTIEGTKINITMVKAIERSELPDNAKAVPSLAVPNGR